MVAGRGADCGGGRFGASIGSCNARLAIGVDTFGFVSVKQRLGQSRFGALMAESRSGQFKSAAKYKTRGRWNARKEYLPAFCSFIGHCPVVVDNSIC